MFWPFLCFLQQCLYRRLSPGCCFMLLSCDGYGDENINGDRFCYCGVMVCRMVVGVLQREALTTFFLCDPMFPLKLYAFEVFENLFLPKGPSSEGPFSFKSSCFSPSFEA